MDSRVLFTEEIDDLEEAVNDLASQLEGFELKKNTMAVVYIDEDVDYDELYEYLSEKWSFPIMGCTSMALLLGEQGFCQNGISAMILTADDCMFSCGITEELDYDNYKQQITEKYEELKKAHDSEIKLIISYGGMVTSDKNVAGDDLVFALSEASGDVPVYGATAADSFSFNQFREFSGDKIRTNGQAIALISGNIDPKFVVVNSVSNRASFSYEVTKADKNTVLTLGDERFMDVLKRENLDMMKSDVLGDYILSPFVVDVEKDGGDRVEVARNLSILNHDTGAGSFLGLIPEGSILNIGIINRPDVQNTVAKAFDTVFDEIGGIGSKYQTIFCNSCVARFIAMASSYTAEADAYMGKLPEGVSLMGQYSYGEYCPVKGNKTGKEYNMFHNFTFTVLVM